MAVPRKISSDCTKLSFAIEETLTKLPSTVVWRELSPTSYQGDFGATIDYMVDSPIGSGRAPKKGIPVKKSVGAGFEASSRQDWIQHFLPGLTFNKAIETGNTNTFNRTSTSATLASVAADGYVGTNFSTANKWQFDDTPLVFAQGFTNAGNNGLKSVTAVTATKLSVTGLTAEASPPANVASLEVCGFAASKSGSKAILTLAGSGNRFTIRCAQMGTGKSGAVPNGTWVHVGGDATASKFPGAGASNTGWARVVDTDTDGIVCDLATFPVTAVATNTANDVHIYVPTRIFKDDIKCDDSQRTSYQLERRLGHADTDLTVTPNEQSQLVTGAIVNQLDLAIPTGDKVMATFGMIAAESFRRTGKPGADNAPWSGNSALPFDTSSLYNTSSDIKYGLIYKHVPTSGAGSDSRSLDSVFGYVTDGTFTMGNNVTAIDAWGVYGAHDLNTGELTISANLTALFTTVEALDLAEEGIDAGLFIVFGRKNAGWILDCPLMTVDTSPLAVAVNEPIKISLENKVNESRFGYAVSFQYYNYLPTVATQIAT